MAVSVIGFIGSVFSPWYGWSGRRNPADHCCINVALYGRGGRWTMTDRGESALRQSETMLEVGPSRMHWDGTALTIHIDERSVPHLDRLKGTIRVHPAAITGVELPLHPNGAHVWRPFAPVADIEVNLDRPGWRWSGHGYLDANFGTRALEADFRTWTWARLPSRDGAVCLYDAARRDGSTLAAAVRFDGKGAADPFEPPPLARLPRSRWALARVTRADPGSLPAQVKAMLDAPFYCRSAIRTTLEGETTVGVHEALDLDRFAKPWLKPMLAVKVPRRARWEFD
jgi:carotenoid 1,2-hydratase